MKTFIIGGTGFLGYYTCLELLRRGHEVSTLAHMSPPDELDFPQEVKLDIADMNKISDEALLAHLQGAEGLIFAAGVDDRVVPKAPAYPFFYAGNVSTTERIMRLAKQAGVKRAVIFSSYFVACDRMWPELKLSETHPYIKSRVEQIEAAKRVAGDELTVSFLALPYIFGAMPGRMPLWAPLLGYLESALPWVFYPAGGSAMVGVKEVARAAVGALERGERGKLYHIASENLGWTDFLTRFGHILHKHKKIITLPNWLVKFGASLVVLYHKLQGREAGLDLVPYVQVQTRNAFLNLDDAPKELGYEHADLQEAFEATVEVYRALKEKTTKKNKM